MQQYIFLDELQQAPAPAPLPFGVSMVGPVIYTFGNQQQKDRISCRAIANLDDWWCQGFSEPGAGSDLAGLSRRRPNATATTGSSMARRRGRRSAQHADWIFNALRAPIMTAKKQQGISFILCDMKTRGITVRPIVTIDGGVEVNEVFFDDVRVPLENLVGRGEQGLGLREIPARQRACRHRARRWPRRSASAASSNWHAAKWTGRRR